MTRYLLKTIPVEEHTCTGPAALADWMWKTCRTPYATRAEYMKATSQAAWNQQGAGVRYENEGVFVADLITAGLVWKEDFV